MPLVAAQPGIWVADQLSPLHNAYAVAHYIELKGDINSDCLLRAIGQGMGEADTLRMRFAERDGIPVQWVADDRTFDRPDCLDLGAAEGAESAALALMQEDLAGDMRALSGKPLYRHMLIRVARDRWFWYQRYHHLQVDGFSFTAVTRRIAALYTALMRLETPSPPPFTPFRAVVEEYQAYHQSDAWQRDAAFWREKAGQLPAPATLALKPLSGQAATTRLLRHTLNLDTRLLNVLVTGQQRAPGVADLALALVALWFARLSGQTSYAAGFIFMRRMGSAALDATGPVINVLPLAVNVGPRQTLGELASTLSGELKSLRRHQRYDSEQVQRDLGRTGDGQPMFGPVFNLKMFDFQLDFAGVEGVTRALASGPVRDVEIALYLGEQEVAVELVANAERYTAAELAGHARRLPLLLRQFAAAPALQCGRADLLDAPDHALLARINDTARPVAPDTLSTLLARQALRAPQAMALMDTRRRLTYGETREQVLALAQRLVARGVRPGDIVAVALPRSVFLSLALMAIVEVGAAYLPLDTGYPDDRLWLMLDDARPRLIITSEDQAARFDTRGALLLYDAPLAQDPRLPQAFPGPSVHHPAYIIYTSGSTGRPKGVVVAHDAIVNRLLWMQDHYPLTAADVVLQKTPCSFDVSVWEFFWPLIVGARLVMAPPDAHRDPQALLQLMADYRVTTLHFVPSMLAAFVTALADDDAVACCGTLRRVFCSGEALPAELSRLWQRRTGVELHNLYGPTEAAVDVSWYPAHGEVLAAIGGANVPIGFPVWNTGLRILDGRLRPVPPGVAGDLYLTGAQLAQGYLARAELTASRFVADPDGDGGRMYRTGDIARWLDNGAVEYLGRSDDQLKIRGQRVELSEIDHALLLLPGVRQAVTHARVLGAMPDAGAGGDARQLVGYLVAQPGETLHPEALRAALAERLPAHMVPVALVELPALPLSANGKLDRKALPLPRARQAARGRAPQTATERRIAALFAQLLQQEIGSVDDDFFALGGHSLLAMRLAAELRRALGKPVTVGQVMVASTVAQLAVLLDDNGRDRDDDAQRSGLDAVLPLRHGNGPPLFCFHPASGFAWQFSVLRRYLDPRWPLVGIQSPRPDGPLQRCDDLEQVCDAHLLTVRNVQPHGPYHFIGYSLGGTLAQGIAARLRAAGETVAFLGLLDTYPPETRNWNAVQGKHVLDPEVLEEVRREREQFIAAQQGIAEPAGGGQRRLFDDIEGNYADSVRLLAASRSAYFAGEATLFVARRTLPADMDVRQTWSTYVGKLSVHELDCAHVDIISPASFQVLGPLLNQVLREL
ncbi:enterobactin synthase subunit F [Acerihabitans arboris]|uniref:Amino acid adenylation domain-containing protein n=1 Tax=Acerihabitans arboris TaxID=2691583 RepID=A0A845SFM4_9GAMM|nr:enterobactin synthase subunit F [Acerihabitans arboris]NDL63833.1 amino acid adenylation domain-containing protein [Acerihabitans arboris]